MISMHAYIYDYNNIIDAVKNDFDPYCVLGISKDLPSEKILAMWNKYKGRKMYPQVKRAFVMLVVPVNRFVYDKMMEYVAKKGKNGVASYCGNVDDELKNYIAQMEKDIVWDTKQDFERDVNFARSRMQMSNPVIGADSIEHVARFVRNNEGFWFYSKDNSIGDGNIVDIYKRKDKYLYYINEERVEYLIESRYLFIDFNKPTKFDGVLSRLTDVACCLKGNLQGHFTEINNMDPQIFMKYHYFRNSIGNIYTDHLERDGLVLRVVDVNKGKVNSLSKLIHERKYDKDITYSSLQDFDEFYLHGSKVTEDDEKTLLEDAKIVNPDDVLELKKLIGRREI